MATNFEFYKNNLKENFARWNTETCDVEAIEKAIGFKICEGCHEVGCSACILNAIEWLSSEHIEAPKLTKRERAFCEAVQVGWIARDENGVLYWFPQKESVEKRASIWSASEYTNISFMILDFSFIKWSDENPWSIEDLLKLDVMEVQEDA